MKSAEFLTPMLCAYVAGLLSEQAAEEVQEMLALHPALQKKVRRLQACLLETTTSNQYPLIAEKLERKVLGMLSTIHQP
ncbi:hypothetical protein [Deminuibacter soli]|uniref:Anti-sigma factor n=1 Tax=Deminuibacter soli TaxID=2291815 RepID=A0A3E1NIS7_9BACT|nr:hypothetical protein [Deminuibacter soli]RFM27843.1 hypothetical protein DXN05_14205 [Deminuibacter soli]